MKKPRRSQTKQDSVSKLVSGLWKSVCVKCGSTIYEGKIIGVKGNAQYEIDQVTPHVCKGTSW